MSACRSCGAEVLWAVTVKGKRIPLDPEPSVKGTMTLARADGLAPLAETFYVTTDSTHRVAVGFLTPEERAAAEPLPPLYLAHHASCPQGRDWKRP